MTLVMSSLNALFDCLANPDRRRILGTLYKRRPDSLTQRDLVTYLSPEYQEGVEEQDSRETVQQKLLSLYHTHLPKLEAAALITTNSNPGVVSITDHPAFTDSALVQVICGETTADSDSLDTLFAALASSRRRTILDVLSHQVGAIHTETLARELAANEEDVPESDVKTEDVQQLLTDIRHVHLPHLSEAALIEYETGKQTVAYKGHPELRVPWIHSLLEPKFRPSLTGESEPEGIGEIHGREQVVSFGQSLCDRANEELFCMFTDTGLLEAGCFARIQRASDRGVDVYLGTRDPTVRRYIEENAPEVIVWEPNTDWLNMPLAGDRVGRLLLADREAVMLGTLREETADGVHEEQAIIGEGTHDTLVTMISQLLGPHLEQIDEETEDIASKLPL